jgi:ABC-2 type transport system ATP-binding protein
MNDTAALETTGLGKRYRSKWGLKDCTLSLPKGRVAALVGPNGAGKSTLLRMAAGITTPSAGDITVFGSSPQHQTVDVLARIGYLDQERPLYKSFRVSEMLRMGRKLNGRWDDAGAREYLGGLDISLDARVGKLSVGQQAQVALTLCIAKRPDLLLLDEPVAALDPLARAQLMQLLLSSVAEHGTTVLLSSHALPDLELACDYLIIVSGARVTLAGDLEEVRVGHRLLVGPKREASAVPAGAVVISATDTARQSTWLIRCKGPISDPTWNVAEPTLEEIVLAYLRQSAAPPTSELSNDGRQRRELESDHDEEVEGQ